MKTNMITRAAGVFIRNRKLLLVTAKNRPFYWTPGGKLNPGETPLTALKREIKEELQIETSDIKHYFDYTCPAEEEEDSRARHVHVYIVKFKGRPKRDREISSMVWISKDDIMNKKIILQSGIKNHLIPRLIKDNLL